MTVIWLLLGRWTCSGIFFGGGGGILESRSPPARGTAAGPPVGFGPGCVLKPPEPRAGGRSAAPPLSFTLWMGGTSDGGLRQWLACRGHGPIRSKQPIGRPTGIVRFEIGTVAIGVEKRPRSDKEALLHCDSGRHRPAHTLAPGTIVVAWWCSKWLFFSHGRVRASSRC